MTGSTGPHEMTDIRNAIDELDARIVALIAERQRWVERAAVAKRGQDTGAVRAPARVEQVISKVRALAETSAASPDVVEASYRAMIGAFIELELREHRDGDGDGAGNGDGNGVGDGDGVGATDLP